MSKQQQQQQQRDETMTLEVSPEVSPEGGRFDEEEDGEDGLDLLRTLIEQQVLPVLKRGSSGESTAASSTSTTNSGSGAVKNEEIVVALIDATISCMKRKHGVDRKEGATPVETETKMDDAYKTEKTLLASTEGMNGLEKEAGDKGAQKGAAVDVEAENKAEDKMEASLLKNQDGKETQVLYIDDPQVQLVRSRLQDIIGNQKDGTALEVKDKDIQFLFDMVGETALQQKKTARVSENDSGEDIEDLIITRLVEAPRLVRAPPAAARSQAQPGAYSVEPAAQPQQQQVIPFHLVGQESGVTAGRQQSSGSNLGSNEMTVAPPSLARPSASEALRLSVATQVETPQELAVPVDVESLEEKKSTRRQKRSRQLTLAILAALFLLVIIVAVAVTSAVSSNRGPATTLDESTENEGTNVDYAAHVLSLLPEFSVTYLQDANTPQGRAYDWLLEDPFIANYTDARILQRFALATLFYSTTSDHDTIAWDNSNGWLDYARHECDWNYTYPSGERYDRVHDYNHYDHKYINGSCVADKDGNYESGLFEHLWLYQNNLVGRIPPELSLMPSLLTINFESNSLTGAVPSELALLPNIQQLSLGYNPFQGTVPTEFGKMSNLVVLFLAGTEGLTGTLPTELGMCSKLRTLNIFETSVSGTIPSEYGKLSNAGHVQLYYNNLSGTIPTELAGLSSAEWLLLDHNSLTGTIPSHLGLLTDLWTIYVNANNLHGTIFTEFLLMTKLRQLYVAENSITGQIPSEIGALTDLWRTRLYDNLLSGPIPSEIGNILGDPVPGKFHRHRWQNNRFNSTIPTELGKLTLMDELKLNGNELTGPLPSELARLINLKELLVSENDLTGIIPEEISFLAINASLLLLNVSHNKFSGTVPGGICYLGEKWTAQLEFDCDAQLCGCDCNCTA